MFRIPCLIAAAAIPAVSLTMALAAPAQATITGPSSTIYSATQNACLMPTGPSADAHGAACNGSAVQSFTFQPVSSGPASTFHVVDQATGQCMARYRFGIRPTDCSLDAGWTFKKVGTTGDRYIMAVPSSSQCIQVNPAPPGYPGALFTKTTCSSSASQVLTVTIAL